MAAGDVRPRRSVIPHALRRAAELGSTSGKLTIPRARLKEWRAVATRDEKTSRSFLGVLSLAATMDRLGRAPGMRECRSRREPESRQEQG